MHMTFSVIYACLLACIAPIAANPTVAHGSSYLQNRHADLAKRVEGNVQLFNRGSGSHWSYYDVETGNPGSCGLRHVNTDFTVAMNIAQMNPSWCFKTITMSYGGKTTTATISDTCPGCPFGGLDLTEGLFAFFLGYWPTQGGILFGDWEFVDAVKPVTTPTKVVPKTTKAPVASIAPIVSSSSKSLAKPSTTSVKPSSSVNASSSTTAGATATTSVNYLSGAASGLAVPTGAIDTSDGPSNLQGLTQAFIEISGLAMAANTI